MGVFLGFLVRLRDDDVREVVRSTLGADFFERRELVTIRWLPQGYAAAIVAQDFGSHFERRDLHESHVSCDSRTAIDLLWDRYRIRLRLTPRSDVDDDAH